MSQPMRYSRNLNRKMKTWRGCKNVERATSPWIIAGAVLAVVLALAGLMMRI